VLFASLKRVQESARILEELTRLEKGEGRREKGESGLAPVFKALRFFGYDLEGSIRRRLDRDIVRKDGRPLLCVVMDMDTIGKKGEGRREKAARHQELAGIARELCRNKVDMIQLREPKDLPTREFLRDARAIQGAIRGEKGEGRKEKGESGEGVRFIVNDRVDIALAVGSDGVHLGQGDMPVAEARRLLPANVVIGISVETAEQARCAEQGGADYLGVGAIFATPSKSDVRVIGLAGLRAIRKATRREATRLPIIAIGGVNANNAGRAVRAGAAGIAVISAVFAGGAIRRNVAELRRELGTKHKEALRRFVWVKSA
jgi:thiamine-phosphate diphosphorylase